MSFLSRISVANRKLVALLTSLLVAWGIYATMSLKQQLLPDLSFPAVTVVATYPGAAPEVVEQQITAPIERAVEGVDGVESTFSTSQQGLVQLTVMFSFEADIDEASTEIEQAVAKISGSLPQGVDPQVLTGSTGDMPTMVLAATSDGDTRELAADLDETVVPALRAIDGVNDVSVSGVREQIVTVTPNTAALAKAGLTTQSIVGALGALGGTSSAGQITSDGRNLSLAVGQPVTSLQQVQDLWLSAAGGSGGGPTGPGGPGSPGGPGDSGTPTARADERAITPVQLKSVAAVALTDAPITSLTRTDGKPSLGISITMDHGGSSPAISDDVRDRLDDLQATLGGDATLVVVSDNGPGVKQSVNGLVEEGALGLLMAILVIVLFLRSARATVVTAVSIPLSLLIALVAVWQRGYSLNILTLGALTIAVGRVVDDSIVVLENIKRHLGYGEDRRSAVLSAVREVASAVTSSTLTTVAVFLPVAFVGGFVGVLFGSFAITVSVAMLASLLVSLTVVPVLAYWFLKAPKDAVGVPAEEYRARVEERERHGLLARGYLPVVRWSVGHRKSVLAGAVVLLIATFALAGGLKTTFLGATGRDSIRVVQTMPPGTDLATTDAAAKRVESVVAGVDGIASYQVVTGSTGGFFGSRAANNVLYTLVLTEDADSAAVTDAVRDKLAAITDAGELTVGGDDGPGGSNTISVSVSADDDQTLADATRQVQEAMAGITQVTDVRSDLSESSPQISIVPNGQAAARHGLSTMAVVSALRQAVDGTAVTQVTLDGTAHDVVVKTGAAAPDSLAEVKAITLPTSTGVVRLEQVATVSQIDGPVQRTHVDGDRTNTVSATPVGDNTGAASTAVTEKLATLALPAGASYEIGGVTADQDEAFSQLILAMVAAIALVFLILVAVFRSIRQTLILLVSIPFAFIGAFALLLATDTPLGVAALIGILMLIGIVVTNAIVLMDLVNQYRDRGMSVAEAVVEGGRRRLRPILMTALATIFALLPMALGIVGEGGFISKPLAVVVIGGLATSTLLTLVLIPVLYTMVEGRRERRQARKRGQRPAPAEPVNEPVPVG
ncbi:MAG: efflux RND transporter permease subunit [Hamadaea sp.]|nr:efflux RND transporter permease subunit [Hamadaea sp.]